MYDKYRDGQESFPVVGEEEESVCEVTDDGGQWYQVSEYTYMGFMLD